MHTGIKCASYADDVRRGEVTEGYAHSFGGIIWIICEVRSNVQIPGDAWRAYPEDWFANQAGLVCLNAAHQATLLESIPTWVH